MEKLLGLLNASDVEDHPRRLREGVLFRCRDKASRAATLTVSALHPDVEKDSPLYVALWENERDAWLDHLLGSRGF